MQRRKFRSCYRTLQFNKTFLGSTRVLIAKVKNDAPRVEDNSQKTCSCSNYVLISRNTPQQLMKYDRITRKNRKL